MDNPTSQNQPPQDTIFSDVVNTTAYDKSLKTARIYLYIVAAIQVIAAIVEYTSTADKDLALIASAIDTGLGLIFFILALWSRQKPMAAFTTALIFYVLIHAGLAIIEPSNIYKGIILKVLVIVALIKALRDAREAEKLKAAIGGGLL